ncbi:MAG: SDR family oxidoreductase [Vicinamibacterales bacterium]
METGLRDRVAVVAAASKGLGRAAADALADEGAKLVICARHGAEIQRAAREIADRTGAAVVAEVADVSLAGDIDRLVARAVEVFGGVDVLVTNAGGPKAGPFTAVTDDDWHAGVELTLMSAVRLSRAVIPSMRARGGGRIIHITSVSVKQPIENLVLSNSLRAAVVGMSKTLATELAPDGITVNCVAPGYTLTERVAELNEYVAAREGRPVAEIDARLLRSIPAGRYGEPRELAAVITFLASAPAAYLTGTTIAVDGGYVRGVM